MPRVPDPACGRVRLVRLPQHRGAPGAWLPCQRDQGRGQREPIAAHRPVAPVAAAATGGHVLLSHLMCQTIHPAGDRDRGQPISHEHHHPPAALPSLSWKLPSLSWKTTTPPGSDATGGAVAAHRRPGQSRQNRLPSAGSVPDGRSAMNSLLDAPSFQDRGHPPVPTRRPGAGLLAGQARDVAAMGGTWVQPCKVQLLGRDAKVANEVMTGWHRGWFYTRGDAVGRLVEKRTCRICRASLSRYNSESVCAGCVRQIATTPCFPLWLWDSLPLRRAFAELDLGAALTIIRTGPGLSQLEFATLLGWSQSAVARAEAGQRDSLYDIRRLFEVVDAVGMPREALIPLMLGRSGEEQIEREETGDMSMNRRQFGGGLAGLAAVTDPSQIPVPIKVDAAHVRYLHSSVEKLWTKDQSVGGGSLTRDGLYLYHRARRMLDEADYSEATGRQLMSATGELAVCVGWLAHDADDQNLARELYSEARLLADQSGDDGLAIRAMEKMALQSAYLAHKGYPGGAREAVRLSERATELARHDPSPQLHALLASREAVSHAAVGDRQGFTVAIARAWREVDRGFADDGPVWLRFMNSSEITAREATGRSYLGDFVAAAALYRRSLDATLSPRNGAIYRAGLAAALAASGDVTSAVTEGMIVLPVLNTGGIMSPRTLAWLEPVRRAAARDRTGEEFCAHYDQIGSSPV